MNQNVQHRGRKQCKQGGNYWLGIALLIVGTVLFLRQMDVEFPFWMFEWYTIVFIIGLFIGLRNGFRDKGAIIMMAVGAVFFLRDYYHDFPYRNYMIPALVILLGFYILVRSGRKRNFPGEPISTIDEGPVNIPPTGNPGSSSSITTSSRVFTTEQSSETSGYKSNDSGNKSVTGEDVFDIVTVFGSTKKMVISKDFKGGEIVSVFGGSEVNFIQSDFHDTVEIEVVAIFGGSKLIVPSNWNVRAEAVAIFGGVEDKRDPHVTRDMNKTLVLKGSTIFGGIEVTSYA